MKLEERYLRQSDLLERDTLQFRYLPRVSSVRAVADSNTLEVDTLGQLLRNLRQNIWERGRGLDVEAELALFANKSEYHVALSVLGE
jgi:hypothetical protein